MRHGLRAVRAFTWASALWCALAVVSLRQVPAQSPGVVIVTTALPAGLDGAPYSHALQAEGGSPPLHWSNPPYRHTLCTNTFSETGAPQGWQGESYQSWILALPFSFPIGGSTWTTCRVGASGWICFGSGEEGGDWFVIGPSAVYPADTVDGDIWVEASADSATVRWQGRHREATRTFFPLLDGDEINVSVTLYPDGRIRLAYGAGNAGADNAIGVFWNDGSYPIDRNGRESMSWADDILIEPTPFPPGLALSGNGTVQGTPQNFGTYPVAIVVTDAAGSRDEKFFALAVAANPDLLPPPAVTTPEGEYYQSVRVELSTGVAGATIRCTTDGSDPGEDAETYEEPILLTLPEGQEVAQYQVRARLFREGSTPSHPVAATYTLRYPAKLATPRISPNGGTFDGSALVSLLANPTGEDNTTPGTEAADPSVARPGRLDGQPQLRYTLDGSDPAAQSALYTAPFVLTATATVKARAFRPPCPESDVAMAVFEIRQPRAARPVIEPGGGLITAEDRVRIRTATEGAAIRYTTDGSEPTADSPLYETPLSLSRDTVLKARSFLAGYEDSDTAEAAFSFAPAGSTLTHAGILAQDATWRPGYVHRMTGDVVVPAGVTLTLEPGTEVLVAAGTDATASGSDAGRCELIVQGRLNASGTAERPVRFVSEAAAPQPGDWYGLRAEGTPEGPAQPLAMAHGEVRHAVRGVSLDTAYDRSVSLQDCRVEATSRQGVFLQARNGARVTVDLARNEVRCAGDSGIECFAQGSAWVDGRAVPSIVGGTVKENTVLMNKSNGIAISSHYQDLSRVEMNLAGNSARNNENNGISVYGRGTLQATDNVLSENLAAGLYLGCPYDGAWEAVAARNKSEKNGGTGIQADCGKGGSLSLAANEAVANQKLGILCPVGDAAVRLFRNVASGNGAGGVYVDVVNQAPEVAWNTVTQNAGTGLTLCYSGEAGTAFVTHNTVKGNALGSLNVNGRYSGAGLQLLGSGAKTVRLNDLEDNGPGYELDNGGSGTVDARFNRWGAEATAEMEAGGNPKNIARIRDLADDSGCGSVDYAGWLREPLPLAEAPLCRVSSPVGPAVLPLGETLRLTGLALAPSGIEAVEVSADGGATWSAAYPLHEDFPDLWRFDWTPAATGTYRLRSRLITAGTPLETPGGSFEATITSTDTTPPAPPAVAAPVSPTNLSLCQLSGTKEAGASVVVNGTEVAPVSLESAWACTWPLGEGTNALEVLSRDASGNASNPVVVTVVCDRTPPHAVVELTVAEGGDGTSVSLDWSGYDAARDGDVAAYHVFAREAAFMSVEGVAPTLTVPAGTTRATVVGLIRRKAVYLAVVAADRLGNRLAAAAPVSATPKDTIAPAKVSGLRLQSGAGQLAASWTAPADEAGDLAGYRVYVDAETIGAPAAQTAFTRDGLPPATLHLLRVTAVDDDGNESEGATASGWTFLPNPAEVSAAAASRQVTLSWPPVLPADGLARYAVYRSESPFASVAGMPPCASPVDCRAVVTGLVDGQTYYFAVTAVNVTGGEDPAVSSVPATPCAMPPPEALRAAAREAGAVHLTWAASPTPDLAGFRVYRAAQPFSSPAEATSVNASPVAYTDFDDLPDRDGTWHYRVASVSRSGAESALSPPASAASDRTPPRALSVEYAPGPGTPSQGARFGPGRVDVRLTMSEPQLTTPFLGIVPKNGAALPVALQKESETVYAGSFQATRLTPSGTARAVLSSRDPAGNRGTEIDAGAAVALDTEGPTVTDLRLSPEAPLRNDPAAPATVRVSLALSEAPANGADPELYYALSETARTPQRLALVPAADGWTGFLTLPAEAGANGGEWILFTFHAEDDLGNAGERISGRSSFEVYQGELPPLAAPVIAGKALPGGRLFLSWKPVFGAADYEVFLGVAPAEPGVPLARTASACSFAYLPASDGLYRLAVRSVRTANGQEALSEPSNVVELVSDSVAPEPAANLRLSLTGQGVLAEWDASPSASGGETVTYALFRSGAEIASLDGLSPLAENIAALQATDARPPAGGSYYAVAAADAAGNVAAAFPCAYFNPALLPVSTLAVTRTEGQAPVVAWTHASVGLGFHVYAGEPGSQARLTAEPAAASPFADTTYHDGARLYTVTATDAAGQESPGRSVRLPAVRLGLAPGTTLVRGALQRVGVSAANLDARPLADVGLGLSLAGQAGAAEAFDLAGGETKTVPVVVGVPRDLADPADFRVELAVAPNAGERAAQALEGRVATVAPATEPYAVVLDPGTPLRGGDASLRFNFTNATEIEVELHTARQNGARPSAELRFELVSSTDGVIAAAPVHQYLGEGVTLLPDGTAVARIAPGASFASAPVRLPVPSEAAGELSLRLVVEKIHYRTGTREQAAVPGLSTSCPVVLRETDYTGEVDSAEPATSDGSVPVTIVGRALDRNGRPLPAATLKLVISGREFDRVSTVITGSDGAFTAAFTPNRGEGGLYEVWADHPDVTARNAQKTFAIRLLRVTPSTVDASFPRNYPARFSLDLQAPPGLPAEGIRLSPEGTWPAGVRLVESGTASLAAGAAGKLSFVLGADNEAPATGSLALALVDENGARWGGLSVRFTLTASATAMRVVPSPLTVGVARGGSAVTEAALENIGLQPLEGLRMRLLDETGQTVPAWLGLNGSDRDGVLRLGRVAAGEKRSFSFTAAPGEGTPLSGNLPHVFALRAEGDNAAPVQWPVYVYVGESGEGAALFKVTDLFYGLSSNGVAGARVTLDRQDGLADGEREAVADANGEALLTGLPAGDYRYRVNAGQHDTATGTVRVAPGVTVPVQVALNYQLVSVEWEVRPVTLQDRYEIVLHATFQTQIPAPTLDVEPASVTLDPAMAPGQVLTGEVQVANNGMIAATGISFTPPPADPRYRVEYLAAPPDTLGAHEFFRLPFRVTRLSGVLPDAGPCAFFSAVGVFTFHYLGGDGQVYTGSSPVCWAESFPATCAGSSDGGSLVGLNFPGGSDGVPLLPGADVNGPGQPLCDDGSECTASVRLQIAQELSLERQAFDARMKIANGAGGLSVQNVRVEILFRDAAGNGVRASSDPDDKEALFFLRPDGDAVAGGQEGVWTAPDVETGAVAELHWLIVPAPGAGGEAPAGKLYRVGARLSYTLGGKAHTRDIQPDTITVLPLPELELDYFLPSEVNGDDPLTESVVEPEEPFALGLLLRNAGHGVAKSLRIDSGQPKIVSNAQGLLVKFAITGTEVNGAALTPSLAVSFGDVAPQAVAVARWVMTSSLCGRFVSFGATWTHDDGLGGQLTSLVREVKTHWLLKDVRVDLPGRDALRDFLAGERDGGGNPVDGALAVYESSGTVTPVSDQSAGAVLEPVEGSAGRYTLRRGPETRETGFVTVSVADPFRGAKVIERVTRSDGQVLDPANAWLRRKWVSGGNWEFTLHLFDTGATGLTWEVAFADAAPGNRPPELGYIGPRSVRAGSSLGLQVLATDPDGAVPTLAVSDLPDGASFRTTSNDPASGSAAGEFYWSPAAAQSGEYWITFTAADPEGLGASETVHLTVGDGVAPTDAPVIDEPAEGLQTAENRVSVSGMSREGEVVVLYVNGQRQGDPAMVDSLTRNFRAPVALVTGSNAITAAAAGCFGEGPPCAPVRVVCDPAGAAAPVNVAAEGREAGVVRLTFSTGIQPNIERIVVYRCPRPFTAAEEATEAARLAADAYSYDDLPPADGTWHYRLQVVKRNGLASALSKQVDAVSDRVPPTAVGLVLTPRGPVAADGRVGPGAVDVALTASEPLLAAPFLSFAPERGTPVPVALRANGENTYAGSFTLSVRTPSGMGGVNLSMRDRVGNRGTAVPSGAGLLVDASGPNVKALSVSPPAPICNDTAATVTVSLSLDEAFSGNRVPSLRYVLSTSHPSPVPVELVQVSDQLWTGTFALPPDAGTTPETLSFHYSGEDDLGNVSTRIDGAKDFGVYRGALPPLSAPTGLRAVSAPGGKVVLSWNAVTGSADYRLYRAPAGGPMALLTATGGSTGCTDAPEADGTYRYCVTSVRQENGAVAESPPGAEVAGVADSVPPGAPSNLRLTLTGHGVQAQWTAPAPATESVTYALYRGGEVIADVAGLTPVASGIETPTATDPAPTHELPFYAVAAVDAAGNISAPSPSAFLNAGLLPVSGLTVERVDEGYPTLTWTAPSSAAVVGYNVYTGAEGREVRLNSLPVAEKTFSDESWDRAERRYAVAAVDEYGRESLRRAVVMPLLEVCVAAVPTILRGEFNPVAVGVANNSEIELAVVRAGVRLANQDHVSAPFSLGPRGLKPDARVVVGGYRGLPNLAAFTVFAEVAPGAGDKVVVRRTGGTFPVSDGKDSYTVDILPDPVVAGGVGGVRFRLANHTAETVDLVTAANGGEAPSGEVRLRLLDADGVEIARAALRQATGGGVYNLAGGTSIARVGSPVEAAGGGEADVWLSDPVYLSPPLNAKAPLSVVLDVDKLHYRYGEREYAAIPGFSVTKVDIALSDPPYVGQIDAVAPAESFGAEPVLVTGRITDRATGAPRPEADFVLLLVTDGFVRRIDGLKSDGAGNFAWSFQPLPEEGGVYTVAAVHPAVREAAPQASFAVRRLIVEPGAISARVPRNYGGALTVRLTALAGTTASCIRVMPAEELPAGVRVLVGKPGVPLTEQGCVLSVTGPRTVDLPLTLVGDSSAEAAGRIALLVRSEESGERNWGVVDLAYELVDAAPALRATPGRVSTGVVPGGSVTETVQLKNVGFSALENATVALVSADGSPAPAWATLGNVSPETVRPAALASGRLGGLSTAPPNGAPAPVSAPVPSPRTSPEAYRRRVQSLAQAGSIASLGVNDTRDVTLTFAPGQDVAPAAEPVELVLQVTTADRTVDLEVPVSVYVDASGRGNLLVQAWDLYSGSGVARPAGTRGPKITLQKVDGSPVPDVVAQADDDWSDVLVRDLPAGLWDYRISADNHDAVSGRVEIRPGATETLETLLRNTLVTVEWEVVPTSVRDQYQVVLTADYETQVPAPVLAVTPASIALPYLNHGEVYAGEFLVENRGLIRADHVSLVVPDGGSEYRIEFLSQPPDTLDPSQFCRLPFRVIKLPASRQASEPGMAKTASSSACGCTVFSGCVQFSTICLNGKQVKAGTIFGFSVCGAPCASQGESISSMFPVNFHAVGGWLIELGGIGCLSGGFSNDSNCDSGSINGSSSCKVRISSDKRISHDRKIWIPHLTTDRTAKIVTLYVCNEGECVGDTILWYSRLTVLGTGPTLVLDLHSYKPGKYKFVVSKKSASGSTCTDFIEIVIAHVQIRVDLDNDRLLSAHDDTDKSKQEYFKFWLSKTQNSQHVIEDLNDLENLAQIQIAIPSASFSPTTKAYLQFAPQPDFVCPEIRLYKNTSGGYQYLRDINAARKVIASNMNGWLQYPTYGAIPRQLPAEYFSDNQLEYLLFRGEKKGVGILNLILEDEGVEICRDYVQLEIRDIQDFYSVVNLRGKTPHWDSENIIGKTQPLLLFIHGYDVSEEYAKTISFPTIYKRMYWTGFNGDMIGIVWQGDEDGPWLEEVNEWYFNMENALQTAPQLASFINLLTLHPQFRGRPIHILAHSLGNMVVSQALKEPLIQPGQIQNYFLMQAAVAKNCYGYTEDRSTQMWKCADTNTPNTGFPLFVDRYGKQFLNLNLVGTQLDDCDDLWYAYMSINQNSRKTRYINTYSDEDMVLSRWFKLFAGGSYSISLDRLLARWEMKWEEWNAKSMEDKEICYLSYLFPVRSFAAGFDQVRCLENLNAEYLGVNGHSAYRERSLAEIWTYYWNLQLYIRGQK